MWSFGLCDEEGNEFEGESESESESTRSGLVWVSVEEEEEASLCSQSICSSAVH